MFAGHSSTPGREMAPSKALPSPTAVAASDRIPRTIPSNYSGVDPHPHPPPPPPPHLHHQKKRIPQKIVGSDPIPAPIKRVPINNERPRAASNPIPIATATASNIGRKREFLVEEQKHPISLDGVVDLTNTVDTDVTTRILPAVVHEHITPTQHEIIQERISREIHYHDVYHRILPIIDTEVLPPRHYIYGPDGRTLHEVPESQVRSRTGNSLHSRNWQIVETHPSSASKQHDLYHSMMLGIDPADADTEGKTHHTYTSTFRINPREFLRWARNPTAPIKIMEREYMTAEGFPRKETWWRHPPTLESGTEETGQTVPMFWHWTDDEEEILVAQKHEEELRNGVIYQDRERGFSEKKGYSNGHVSRRFSIPRKPIVQARAGDESHGEKGVGMDKLKNHHSGGAYTTDKPLLGRVLGEETPRKTSQEGEATKYLRRMKEGRSSSVSSAESFRSWGRNSEGGNNRNSTGLREEMREVRLGTTEVV
ncbi:hypothetical protein ACMFMG_005332 [Clarireedia jacksonii]